LARHIFAASLSANAAVGTAVLHGLEVEPICTTNEQCLAVIGALGFIGIADPVCAHDFGVGFFAAPPRTAIDDVVLIANFVAL
jgi:hypothetical protein